MGKKICIITLVIILVAIVSLTVYLAATKRGYEKSEIEKRAKAQEEKYKKIEEANKDIFSKPEKGEEIAIMTIKDYGKIKIKFFKNAAPKAVENFKGLVKKGYYNGLTFHRVIEDFMIQGGDPKGNGTGGESFFGKPFGPEYKEGYFPYRGTICMASSPNVEESLTSQFFIVQAKADKRLANVMKEKQAYDEKIIETYAKEGGTPHLYNKHTVFGYVYEGLDIVDKISAVKKDKNDKPLKSVIIEKVEIKKVDDK